MGRNRILGLATAVVMAVGAIGSLGAAGPAGAVVPGANGVIAFTSLRDGDAEIYAVNADGTGTTNLTNSPVYEDSRPAWSPDGSQIAFQGESGGDVNLFVMNPDGSGQTALTTDGTSFAPTWSPDGSKLAFVTGSGIDVMDVDGANRTHLAGHDSTDTDPSWSPDGSRIAFTSTYDINVPEVAVMNADGTGAVRLTHQTTGSSSHAPTWSPDGTKIGFTRFGVQAGLHVMNADGTGDVPVALTSGSSQGVYSPDGTRGAYVRNVGVVQQIFVTTTDFGARTQITNDPAGANDPAWQPVSAPCAAQRSGTWIGTWNQPDGSGTLESQTTNAGNAISGTMTFLTGSTLLVGGEAVTGVITCNRMTGSAGIVSLAGSLLNDGYEMGGTYSYPPIGPFPGGAGFWHASLVTSQTTGTTDNLTTDPGGIGATPDHPLQTRVETPTTQNLTIDSSSSSVPGYIAGYQLGNQLVHITAPDATAVQPMKFTFDLDASALAGRPVALLTVFRNGIAVGNCVSLTAAIPDPCVLSRTALPNGDARVTVLTSKASVWQFGSSTPAGLVNVGGGSVVEGRTGASRVLSFPVTLSQPASATVTVPYVIETDGSGATSKADFIARSGKLTLKPAAATGLTATSAAVNATVVGDDLTEGDQTFRVRLLTPTTGSFAVGSGSATGTILDDDPPGALAVSVGDLALFEGDTGRGATLNKGVLRITLSQKAPTGGVTVTYQIAGGTATPTTDFTKPITKSVTFAAGQWQKTVAVNVRPDTTNEQDETVTLTVTNPGVASVGRGTGTLTILNDD